MKSFDVIVIGAGSGLDVAVELAQRGLKTAIVEEGPLGGTCLNRGCIPSKMILHAADVAEEIKNSSLFGLNASLKSINFKQVTNRASHIVDKDAREIEHSLRSERNPVLLKGRAKFIGLKTLEVQGEKITAKKIVIAAGTRSTIPPIEGLDKVSFLTSTEALRLTKLPRSMIIVGGGYIGAELGYFFAAMGTKITIIQRNEVLLSNIDLELAQTFTKLWKKKYNVITNAAVNKVFQKGTKIIAELLVNSKVQRVEGEKLLLATGRKPNTDLLQVEKAGVKLNKAGYVQVNQFMETNVPGIYALGDIAGVFQFKHSANLEAEYVIQNILGKKKAVDYYPMPYAVFTNPQIAGVGMAEEQALEQKMKYTIGKYEYKNTGMGAAMEEKDGFVKFIVNAKTKEILGCHILGPQASILLHEVVVAMKADRKKALTILQNTVHVHPALSEVIQRAALNVRI